MPALGALSSIPNELGLAAVTVAMNSLADRLANQVLTTSARRHGKQILLTGLILASPIDRRLLDGLEGGGLNLVLGVLVLLGRVTGTLVATGVLAVDAGLVGAKRSLAAVTGAMDPHANGLDDALDRRVIGLTVVIVDSQAVLGEQGTRSILLDDAPMGDGGWSLLGLLGLLGLRFLGLRLGAGGVAGLLSRDRGSRSSRSRRQSRLGTVHN